jgi:hypothetical protein
MFIKLLEAFLETFFDTSVSAFIDFAVASLALLLEHILVAETGIVGYGRRNVNNGL